MSITLKKMKIHQLKMKLKNPFSTSFGTVQDKQFFIIEAINNEKMHGYGESVAFITPWYTEETLRTTEHIIVDFLIPILQKHPINHPSELNGLFSSIKRNNMAKAAIEGAIWDLYAKQQNKSLSTLLGGTKSKIEVGISIGLQPTVNHLLQKIEHYVDSGYKRVKLKIKPGQDVTLLKTIRRHFPNLSIIADANSVYTLGDIDLLKELDAFNLMMIEQPLASDDIVDHAQLQRAIQTPICLDESITSYDEARKAIKLGSCQVINIKAGRVGGLTEAKHIHDLCIEHHIDVWCGGMLEAGIGRAHNIALSSLPGFNLPGDTAGSSHYWKEDIITPEVIVKDGFIEVPNEPGIGYNVNWEKLNQYKIATQEFYF